MDVVLSKIAVVAISMIILNMIVEKIVSFWKLNGPNTLSGTQDNVEAEKLREMKIANAAIIVGMIIALFLKVDFVALITNEHPEQTFGWELVIMPSDSLTKDNASLVQQGYTAKTIGYFQSLHIEKGDSNKENLLPRLIIVVGLFCSLVLLLVFVSYRLPRQGRTYTEILLPKRKLPYWAFSLSVSLFIACVLTAEIENQWTFLYRYLCVFMSAMLAGAGVSFGAKFWHDLLDLVLEVKKLKSKLSDAQLYQAKNIQQFDEVLRQDEDAYAQLAFSKYEQLLLRIPNVSWISIGTKQQVGKQISTIKINLKDDKDTAIPKFLPIHLPTGIDYLVPTEIVKNCGEIKLHDLSIGSSIGSNRQGTLGCFFTDSDGNSYCITSYHVVLDERSYEYNNLNEDEVAEVYNYSAGNEVIGKLLFGLIDDNLDFCFIKLSENYQSQELPCLNTSITLNEQPLPSGSLIRNTPVQFCGAVSKCTEGIITECSVSVSDIPFRDGNRTMRNIIIAQRNGVSMSQEGDSGSLIYDTTGNAIGIILGGDLLSTFIVPMDSIVSKIKENINFNRLY